MNKILTKLYNLYNGRALRDVYAHATKWQVFKYRVSQLFRKFTFVGTCLATLVLVVGSAYTIGSQLHPITVYAEKTVTVTVKDDTIPPVLQRIAKCESENSHIDPKTGQVLMRSNTNKSVDIGRYQINSVWFKKATELGLDLTKEADNEKMAIWIYENRGTGDWLYSQACWNK